MHPVYALKDGSCWLLLSDFVSSLTTMFKTPILLACLVWIDCGWRLQPPDHSKNVAADTWKPWRSHSAVGQSSNPSKAAAMLLVALHPAAAFHLSGSRALSSNFGAATSNRLQSLCAQLPMSSRVRCTAPCCSEAEGKTLAERGKELKSLLDECSLYIVGVGPVRTEVYSGLLRHVPGFRATFDMAPRIVQMYNQLNQLYGSEKMDLSQMVSKLDREELGEFCAARTNDVTTYFQSLVNFWDGTGFLDYEHMGGQGVIVNVVSVPNVTLDDLELPADDDLLDSWLTDKRDFADITIELEREMPTDDKASKVIDELSEFMAANKAKNLKGLEKIQERLKNNPNLAGSFEVPPGGLKPLQK